MSKQPRLYADIHVLQTMPPSCVNRDDTGSPKTAVYGGVTRARVSSQAWKKPMRGYFLESGLFPPELMGKRTKRIVSMVAQAIYARNAELPAEEYAELALKACGFKVSKDAPLSKVDALFFMSARQADAIAEVILANESAFAELKAKMDKENEKKAKKKAKEGEEETAPADDKAPKIDKKIVDQLKTALSVEPSVDMLLFGRMLAGDTNLSVDACAQVAHAISTHLVRTEYDYFTAVSDPVDAEDVGKPGADHMGTIEFNSSTLYRYANVNVLDLYEKLKDEAEVTTAHVVRGFAEAFIRAMPNGKQNTFANRTLPGAVYVALRTDAPVCLASAFENPVKAKDGYMKPSKEALVKHVEEMFPCFAKVPEKAWVVGKELEKLGESATIDQMLDALEAWIAEALNEVEK